MIRQYPNLVQGSGDWHAARRGMVTSSVVAKLVTPSTLKVANNDTSRGLVAALVAERLTGTSDDTPQTGDMFRGIYCEPFAREAYHSNYAPVREMGLMVRDDWGFSIGYSPDGLVGEDGAIEIKCPRAKNHLTTLLTDEIPSAHWPQLQTALLVTGRAWIDFVSFFGGMPLYRKRVEPDPAWHDAIVAAVAAFEAAAAQAIAAYEWAAGGLPATEPIPDLELVI